jgi:hypothetical protein
MLNKYQVTGMERVAYRMWLLANSKDEAVQKFFTALKIGDKATYTFFTSGIEVEVEELNEEE